MHSLRLVALTVFASLAVACSEDDDLKDTRPGDTGALSVEEVAFVDSEPVDTGDVPVDSATTDTGSAIDATTETASDTGTTATDGVAIDSTVGDTGTAATDSAIDSTIVDTGMMTDTSVTDSTVADTAPATDSVVADTTVADTRVADTFVADTDLLETALDDTGIDDTAMDEMGVADTDIDIDTGDGADSSTFDTGKGPEAASAFDPKPLPFAPARTRLVPTTTSGQIANIAWDAHTLSIEYPGVARDAWIHVYLSTGLPGTLRSEMFGSQQVLFAAPVDRAIAIRADGSTQSFKQWSHGAWLTMPMKVEVVRTGDRVRIRIPFAVLGASSQLSLGAFVRDLGAESIAGALDPASLMDGYSPAGAPKTVARALRIERTHG